MNNLVDEFNNTANMCVEFILSVTNDSDLRFYKKAADNIISVEKSKGIEQFIIYCLPHEEYVHSEDEAYFVNMNNKDMKVDDDSKNLFHILKLRTYFTKLDDDVKKLIFEYLKLLCSFSKEYLKLRLNQVKK